MRMLALLLLLIFAEVALALPMVTFPTGPYRRANEHMPIDIHFDSPPSLVILRGGDGVALRFEDGAAKGYLGVNLYSPPEAQHFELFVDGERRDIAWPSEVLARSNTTFLLGVEEGLALDESKLPSELKIVRIAPQRFTSELWRGDETSEANILSREEANCFYDFGAFDALLRPHTKGLRLEFPFCAAPLDIAPADFDASRLYEQIREARGGHVNATKALSLLSFPTQAFPPPPDAAYVDAGGMLAVAIKLVMLFGILFGWLSFVTRRRVTSRNATMKSLMLLGFALVIGLASIFWLRWIRPIGGVANLPTVVISGSQSQATLFFMPSYAAFMEETSEADFHLARTFILRRPKENAEIIVKISAGKARAMIPAGTSLMEIKESDRDYEDWSNDLGYQTIVDDGSPWVVDRENSERIAVNDFGSAIGKQWPEANLLADYWLKALFVNRRDWSIRALTGSSASDFLEKEQQPSGLLFTRRPKE